MEIRRKKNITHPTVVKLYSRVIETCWRIPDAEEIELRQRYSRVRKKYLYLPRFRKSKVRFKEALRAERKLRVIAGRLTRELVKRNPRNHFAKHAPLLDVCMQIVHQKKDSDKIYSVHEPVVQCISKGKEYEKYEFGCKVSLSVANDSGVWGES